ncbi:MAG TPA: glycosyltransferase family 1 protein [Chloroflexota bacterium]|nr:glycosyltransferase family 1 protein [Chloroflexota bacterium]
MRVGIDARIASYTLGGTGVYARRLSEALAVLPEIAKHELLLLHAPRTPAAFVPPRAARVHDERLFTPSHHRLEQLLLPLELAPRRMDVLHSTDYIPPFVRTFRSVITVHDLAFLRWPELLTPDSRRYFNGHIRRAVRSADRIIAVSQATARDLVELLDVPERKIDVVYEAGWLPSDVILSGAKDLATLAGEDPSAAQRPQDDGPRDYVLFAGTYEPRKNLPLLVRAFAQVRRRGYEGSLVLAGRRGWLAEPLYAEVERQALGDAVVMTDLQPELYRRARLLAFPSLYEGFGLPVLEAMSVGTPVVTSNLSSLPEVAGDAALLVDPHDETAVADAMWRILSDAALAEDLGRRGRQQAAKFSWERAARDTLAVYEKAAS